MSFERHTRRKIKNHPSEVDTDALWNSIKNDIPQEKDKKKRAIFFLFFGIAIIASVVVSNYHLILEQNRMGSLIAIHQESNSSNQIQHQDNYLTKKIITNICDESHSESDNETLSIQSEYSANVIEEKEISHNNQTYVTIANYNISNISPDDSKVVPYVKPKKETEEEVLSIIIKEKEEFSPLADNIPNAKNIPVEKQEINEELILKITLQEGETEEEKKESKKKNPSTKSNYSLFAHADVSISLKGQSLDTQNSLGIIEAKEDFQLITQHIGISKDFGNKILISSDISYAILSEKISFKSIKSNTGALTLGPKVNTQTVASHVEIKESSTTGTVTNANYSNTSSTGNSNSINLEAINKTKFLGLSFSIAYKHTFKNEKVFLLLGAGAKMNIRIMTTGYTRTAGFNNHTSNSFIAQQNDLDQKELTISPTLSPSFNFKLNSRAYLILGVQYQANPNLFGINAGIRFNLGSK